MPPRSPTRRDVLAGASAAVLTGCGGLRRPNVLVVLLDQLRAQALSALGEANIATPGLDAVVEEGTAFTDAITANPVCAPARASLWTGLVTTAHRVRDNGYRLDPRHTTCFSRLRGQGYRTGYIGKWHLYGKVNPGFVPPSDRFGQQWWRGYNVSHRYREFVWFEDDATPRRPDPSDAFEPEVQTDQAVDFVRSSEGPWALVVSYGPPHPPGIAPIGDWSRHLPDGLLARVDPEALALRANVPVGMEHTNDRHLLPDGRPDPGVRAHLQGYYALILAMDALVARLLRAVDTHAPDTLVVLAADHGEQGGSHGLYAKSQPWEESLRVPLVFRWPGVVPAGRRLATPASLLDVAPTLLDLVGARPLPRAHGQSLAGAVLGDRPGPRPAVLAEGNVAGDDAWFALRTDRWTLVDHRDRSRRPRLYDRLGDPFQQEDRADEPGLRGLQQELSHLLAWERRRTA